MKVLLCMTLLFSQMLAAQTLDIDLNEIREDVKLFVPHMSGNFRPADDPVRFGAAGLVTALLGRG